MGVYQHECIIVTGELKNIQRLHNTAHQLFRVGEYPKIITKIVYSPCNDFATFVVTPDGSKVGWETHETYNKIREKFLKIVRNDPLIDYVQVSYGEQGKLIRE